MHKTFIIFLVVADCRKIYFLFFIMELREGILSYIIQVIVLLPELCSIYSVHREHGLVRIVIAVVA